MSATSDAGGPHARDAAGACSSVGGGIEDRQARDELIERFLPLARKLARRYAQSSEPYDDLVQVASLGLVKAVERFDPDRGFAFSSFAVPTIVGELKRYFRDTAWALHVDRGAQERARKITDAQQKLSPPTGRMPTVDDIAQYLEISQEEVLDGLQTAEAYGAVSLDAPLSSEDDEERAGWMRSARRISGSGWSTSTPRSSPPPVICRPASARSSTCASARISRSRRSPSGSASPRCRSRACCAARCTACAN